MKCICSVGIQVLSPPIFFIPNIPATVSVCPNIFATTIPPLIIILYYYCPSQTVAFFISLVGALPPRPLYDYAVNFPVANANAGETTRNMGGEHESVAKPHVPV